MVCTVSGVLVHTNTGQSVPTFRGNNPLHASLSAQNKSNPSISANNTNNPTQALELPTVSALPVVSAVSTVPIVPLEVALTDMGTQLKFNGQVEQGMLL